MRVLQSGKQRRVSLAFFPSSVLAFPGLGIFGWISAELLETLVTDILLELVQLLEPLGHLLSRGLIALAVGTDEHGLGYVDLEGPLRRARHCVPVECPEKEPLGIEELGPFDSPCSVIPCPIHETSPETVEGIGLTQSLGHCARGVNIQPGKLAKRRGERQAFALGPASRDGKLRMQWLKNQRLCGDTARLQGLADRRLALDLQRHVRTLVPVVGILTNDAALRLNVALVCEAR